MNVISTGNQLQSHGNRLHLWKTIFRNIWATSNQLLPSGNRLPETKMLCKIFVKIKTHLANQLCFSKTFLRVYLNSYLEIFSFAWHLAFFILEIHLEWSLKFLSIIKIILEALLLHKALIVTRTQVDLKGYNFNVLLRSFFLLLVRKFCIIMNIGHYAPSFSFFLLFCCSWPSFFL